MKYSEQFFKFPIKIYSDKDWKKIEQIEKTEDSTGTDMSHMKEEPDAAKGWRYIMIEDILSVSCTFSYFRNINDVKEEGFDLTKVDTRYGLTYVSIWPPEKFIAKMDEFINSMKDKSEEENKKRVEDNIMYIREKLKEGLDDILKEYEKHGIPIETDVEKALQKNLE